MKFELAIQTAKPPDVQIEQYFRHQLQIGALKSGQRLPSNAELAKQFRVSPRVVQKAMARLTADGLLDRARKRGTFIRPATEKAVIGVLFGVSLEDETAHFYRALLSALRAGAREHEWTCRVYDGVNPATDPDNPHHEDMLHHLEDDVRNYAFKGQLHIGVRWQTTKRIEQDCGLPVARLDPDHAEADAQYDLYQFVRDSMAFLAQRGRRKLVFLNTPWRHLTSCPELDAFWDEAHARCLGQTELFTIPQTGPTLQYEAEVHKQVAVMIRQWRERPEGMPDGLIVDDDIMMRGVALAVLTAGVKVPEEIMIVTQANDRVHLHYGVPVIRYEFPVGALANALVKTLWKRMVGETTPSNAVLLRGRIKEGEA